MQLNLFISIHCNQQDYKVLLLIPSPGLEVLILISNHHLKVVLNKIVSIKLLEVLTITIISLYPSLDRSPGILRNSRVILIEYQFLREPYTHHKKIPVQALDKTRVFHKLELPIDRKEIIKSLISGLMMNRLLNKSHN